MSLHVTKLIAAYFNAIFVKSKHKHKRETDGIEGLFTRILTKCLNKKNK